VDFQRESLRIWSPDKKIKRWRKEAKRNKELNVVATSQTTDVFDVI